MVNPNSVELIRDRLTELVGTRLQINANRGRRRYQTYEGTLEATYPSIFILRVESPGRAPRNVSFSYADVLMHSVLIAPVDDPVSRPA